MEKLKKRKTKIENPITKEVIEYEEYNMQDIVDKINEIVKVLNEITNK